jgi:DNA-damage-inducible protein D
MKKKVIMKKIGDKYTNNIFENIKHIDEHESEYWYARELSKVLEYRDWRNFLKVLNKAKDACKNSGFNIDEQLVEVNRLSKRNNNAIANIQDYKLSRRKGAFKNKIFLKDVEED